MAASRLLFARNGTPMSALRAQWTNPSREHPAGPYSVGRLWEWAMAVMMVMISLTLALPGDTMSRGALAPLTRWGFTEGNLAFFFGVCGALRGLALYANGNINNGIMQPSGATIRAWGALAAAVVWGNMLAALALDATGAVAPSLNIPIFGTFTMFELLSCYVARMDAVRRKDALRDALAELPRVESVTPRAPDEHY